MNYKSFVENFWEETIFKKALEKRNKVTTYTLTSVDYRIPFHGTVCYYLKSSGVSICLTKPGSCTREPCMTDLSLLTLIREPFLQIVSLA